MVHAKQIKFYISNFSIFFNDIIPPNSEKQINWAEKVDWIKSLKQKDGYY